MCLRAFLIYLISFYNRQRTPIRMRSDIGTNIIGAWKVLRAENQLWDFDRIEQMCAQRSIEWVCNCRGNPEAGGCWEGLEQCVKRLLYRVLKKKKYHAWKHLEAFRTFSIINNRPPYIGFAKRWRTTDTKLFFTWLPEFGLNTIPWRRKRMDTKTVANITSFERSFLEKIDFLFTIVNMLFQMKGVCGTITTWVAGNRLRS